MQTEQDIQRRINRYKLYNSVIIVIAIGISALVTLFAEPITWAILVVLLWSLTTIIFLSILTKIRELRGELNAITRVYPQQFPVAQPVPMMYYTAQPAADPFSQGDFQYYKGQV